MSSVLVRVHDVFRSLFDGRNEFSMRANSLRELVEQLVTQEPTFSKHFVNREGQLSQYNRIYVNEEDVRQLQNLDTPLKYGDEVTFIPAIPGG